MTDDIYKKYKTDNLSPDELLHLRDDLSKSSDECLAECLAADWDATSDVVGSTADRQRVASLYGGIASRLFGDRHNGHIRPTIGRRIFRIAQIAAVVMLPIALVAVGFLYHENRSLASDMIVVSTGDGEQATVSLPDGSRVAVNHNTRLMYVPSKFRGSERRVTMDGEGLYCVAHDAKRPFIVDADGLAVKVLGTKFNLRARDNERDAELVLVEGSVSFTSLKNSESQMVKPRQKIVLDKTTGHLNLIDLESTDYAVAWRRKELVFRDTPLSMVFAQMRKEFHTDIAVAGSVDQRSLFTGTLSSVNLNENLEIIDLSCGLHSRIIGKTVFVEKDKK